MHQWRRASSRGLELTLDRSSITSRIRSSETKNSRPFEYHEMPLEPERILRLL